MLNRRALVAAVLQDRRNLLVIASLGAPAWDITAVGDCPANLPLWGGMGGAVAMGLGLALAQPSRPVLVVAGDGEMLMGMGTLATVAVQRPANLSILVQDNEHYGETGMQETHTRHGVDLVGIAAAAGIRTTMRIMTIDEIPALRVAIHAGQGPVFALAKIDTHPETLVLPPREGAVLQARMRETVMGPDAHHQL